MAVRSSALLALVVALGSGQHLLSQSLADLARQAEKRGLRTGIVVRDLRTGEDLYRHRPGEWFLPASNQKLVTAAAAVWGLGREYRFRTTFRLRAGALEVLAAGDPNWLRGSENDPEIVFAKVAKALRDAGVTTIREIRLRPGAFGGPIRPPGWPKDQFDRTYCAPTGGLVLEAGCFRARIAAAAGSARVTLVAPRVDTPVGGRIKMSSKRKRRFSYWVSHRGDRFTGHGEFSTRAKAVEVRGVCQDPAWLFRAALRSALRRGGITVAATARPEVRRVLTWESPMTEAFAPMLAESSNFHAEQLFRVLGAKTNGAGTFAGGAAAVRQIVGTRLAIPDVCRIADGSGLSRENRTTPDFLVSLLYRVFRGEHARLFAKTLARGGMSGTLKRRFKQKGQKVVGAATRAKTGTIRGVKAISGIVQTPRDGVRIFSILMNRDKGSSTAGASRLQDEMIEAIYHGRYPSR